MLVLAGGAFVFVTTETLPIGLLPQIAGSLGVGVGAAGLLVTGYAAVVVLTAVPLTALAARPRASRATARGVHGQQWPRGPVRVLFGAAYRPDRGRTGSRRVLVRDRLARGPAAARQQTRQRSRSGPCPRRRRADGPQAMQAAAARLPAGVQRRHYPQASEPVTAAAKRDPHPPGPARVANAERTTSWWLDAVVYQVYPPVPRRQHRRRR